MAQEAFEVLGQLPGAAVPPPRVLLQTFQTDGFQIPGHSGLQPARRHRRLAVHLLEGAEHGGGLERGPGGQHLVEGGSQLVDVRGRANPFRFAPRLFGGHVTGGAQQVSLQRGAVGRVHVQAAGQAEIGDPG